MDEDELLVRCGWDCRLLFKWLMKMVVNDVGLQRCCTPLIYPKCPLIFVFFSICNL